MACISIESRIHGKILDTHDLTSLDKVKAFILDFPDDVPAEIVHAFKNIVAIYKSASGIIDFTQQEAANGIPFKFLLCSQSPHIYTGTKAIHAREVRGVLKLLEEKGWIAWTRTDGLVAQLFVNKFWHT